MKLEVKATNVYICDNKEVLRILEEFQERGIKVMESPEVTAFRESVSASLSNITADIQRLLDRPTTSLSEEDKAALQDIADKVAAAAAIVPES